MKVGIQLFSVKNSMAKDPIQTIKDVANIGYKYLEVANHNSVEDPGVGFGVSVADMKKVLDETGTKVVSAHIGGLSKDNIDAVLDYHVEIGTKNLVIPMMFFETKGQTKEYAKMLNELGAICKARGVNLLYHNHFQEFMNVDGEVVMDILMDNTDPENVGLQLDTYWAMRGGQDPVKVIEKYGKRIKLIHQKDYPEGHNDEIVLTGNFDNNAANMNMKYLMENKGLGDTNFTEIGKGIMDIQSIIDITKKYADVDYLILEQDYTELDEVESIKVSLEELKKYNGLDL